MPQTVIKIKTWTCKTCTYKQDFEPTQDSMNLHFNQARGFRLSHVKADDCPSCLLRGESSKLVRGVTDKEKMTMRVMGEEDLEQEIVDLDIQKKERTGKGMTVLQKSSHRKKRKEDIQEAIKKARLLEDK